MKKSFKMRSTNFALYIGMCIAANVHNIVR